MPNYLIECIEKEADNAIVGAKPLRETTEDVTYFSGIRITRSALRFGGRPVITNLTAPVYYQIDGNVVTLRGSSSSGDQYYKLPLNSCNLTAAELKSLLDDCNCCSSGGGGGGDDDYVVSGAVVGSNLVLTLESGDTVSINVSTLVNTDDYVVSGAVSGNTLTLTLESGDTVDIDVSSLVGGGGGDGTPYVNDESGSNAPGGAVAPSNPPASPASGSVVIEAWDDAIRYWNWNGSAWSLAYEQSLSVVAASQSVYDAGLGFWVKGTPGVTVVSGGTGIYNVDIPAGGIVDSIQKRFTNAGTEYTVGGEVILSIDWNTGAFNTSFANAILPDIELYDPAGTEREPGAVFVTAQTTSVAGGVTSTTVANINGLGVPINMKITL